jgi:hydrogenase-4 component F
VNAAFVEGLYLAAGLFLGLLAVVFVGMGTTVLAVVQGEPPTKALNTPYRDSLGMTLPILLLMGLVLLLGLYLPAPLEALLQQAAQVLEPSR